MICTHMQHTKTLAHKQTSVQMLEPAHLSMTREGSSTAAKDARPTQSDRSCIAIGTATCQSNARLSRRPDRALLTASPHSWVKYSFGPCNAKILTASEGQSKACMPIPPKMGESQVQQYQKRPPLIAVVHMRHLPYCILCSNDQATRRIMQRPTFIRGFASAPDDSCVWLLPATSMRVSEGLGPS